MRRLDLRKWNLNICRIAESREKLRKPSALQELAATSPYAPSISQRKSSSSTAAAQRNSSSGLPPAAGKSTGKSALQKPGKEVPKWQAKSAQLRLAMHAARGQGGRSDGLELAALAAQAEPVPEGSFMHAHCVVSWQQQGAMPGACTARTLHACICAQCLSILKALVMTA